MSDSPKQPDNIHAALANAFAQSVDTGDQILPPEHSRPLLERIIEDLKGARTTHSTPAPQDQQPAALIHLDALLADMPQSPLARTVAPLLERLVWYRIFEDERIDARLADGLLAAQIIGGRGIYACRELFMGLFLLAPNVVYPLHQHSALEIYHVLSGEISIRHGRAKKPVSITPGRHSVTPPHQVHELATGEMPCLIAYVWTGDIDDENWWWQRDDDGAWERVCWKRQADASWRIDRHEALTASEVSRAGDK